jgi:hypothetical protein
LSARILTESSREFIDAASSFPTRFVRAMKGSEKT